MIRYIAFVVVFTVSTLLGWNTMNWGIPKIIMNKAMEGLAQKGEGINAMTLREPADPYRQFVVRPSPDLLYSTCVYDLENSPLSIAVGPTNGYLSISFYDDLTNNFETIEGASIDHDQKTIALVWRDQQAPESSLHVRSPSRQGLVLVRRQISNQESLTNMLAAQKRDACDLIYSKDTNYG